MMLENGLKVNSRIEVALANDENQVFGHSLIQEVLDESFSIMIPVYDGHTLYLDEGDEVIVSILINKVRYAFKTEVISKKMESDIKLVVLKMPKQIATADRRNLVRIKTLLPVKYEILEKDQMENWENIELSKEAFITDLSGKGLSLSFKRPLSMDEIMVLSIYLKTDNINVNVKLLGEVVRCEQIINRRYQIGVQFLKITPRQEDLIVKYVFHCLRRSIQLNRDDY